MKQFRMPLSNPADDPFTELAQHLGELEIVISETRAAAIAGMRTAEPSLDYL